MPGGKTTTETQGTEKRTEDPPAGSSTGRQPNPQTPGPEINADTTFGKVWPPETVSRHPSQEADSTEVIELWGIDNLTPNERVEAQQAAIDLVWEMRRAEAKKEFERKKAIILGKMRADSQPAQPRAQSRQPQTADEMLEEWQRSREAALELDERQRRLKQDPGYDPRFHGALPRLDRPTQPREFAANPSEFLARGSLDPELHAASRDQTRSRPYETPRRTTASGEERQPPALGRRQGKGKAAPAAPDGGGGDDDPDGDGNDDPNREGRDDWNNPFIARPEMFGGGNWKPPQPTKWTGEGKHRSPASLATFQNEFILDGEAKTRYMDQFACNLLIQTII